MFEELLIHEPAIYAFLFFGVLGIVAIWEGVAPRRVLTAPLRIRWLNTLAVYLTGVSVMRLLFPLLGVGVALAAQERGWGLFNVWAAPVWLAPLVSLLAIDAGHYGQHYFSHRFPALWRIHRMHHTDRDYDFTTGLRFHPIESVLTTVCDLSLIVALGAPPLAVIAYEFVYVVVSIAAHGNVRVPGTIDRVLRTFLVTPDLHRVHHSASVSETDSNYGAVLPWWDRIFGTYVAQPARGHQGMEIGLADFHENKHLTVWWMLINPLLSVPDQEKQMRFAKSTGTVPMSWNKTAKAREE